jgi:AbiU2
MQGAEFERELEIFRNEVEGATQLFYAYIAVYAAMSDHQKIEDWINEASLFWKTCLYGLQSSTFIVLGRVFDQDKKSKHNIDRLIGIAQRHPEIFSKGALGKRKQGTSPRWPDWLDKYLDKACVPKPEDFRRIRKHVAKWRRVYDSKYRPIRHQIYAHRGVTGDEGDALWAKTQTRELQLLLKSLRELQEALWQLYHNGHRPVLRPQRYSLKNMRDRPSNAGRINAVQEQVVFEAESFLRKGSGLPPPKTPRKKSEFDFDI